MTPAKKAPEGKRRGDERQSTSRLNITGSPLDVPSERSPDDPLLRKLAEDVAKAEEDPTSNTPTANPNTND